MAKPISHNANIAALDVGTTKIACFIAQVGEHIAGDGPPGDGPDIHVVGIGHSSDRGDVMYSGGRQQTPTESDLAACNEAGVLLDESADPKDVTALAACGKEIRSWLLAQPFPAPLEREIREYFQELEKQTSGEASFAVRSSATAEDLPDADFAGRAGEHVAAVDAAQPADEVGAA